ncbi:uncharacterized protein FIBRA_08800 [Fibroporia radiculosa]|uniref:Uncharacterized protein n=1 Tax=Fibroporia radiculosa TaxID=599839 RepID=J4I3C4_9APHY|nr:uncharacterized protein FIBRA_08800 [Fibroporia radiculosa]CCM06527.1 predicted protein [Fibroporia radiculosa]
MTVVEEEDRSAKALQIVSGVDATHELRAHLLPTRLCARRRLLPSRSASHSRHALPFDEHPRHLRDPATTYVDQASLPHCRRCPEHLADRTRPTGAEGSCSSVAVHTALMAPIGTERLGDQPPTLSTEGPFSMPEISAQPPTFDTCRVGAAPNGREIQPRMAANMRWAYAAHSFHLQVFDDGAAVASRRLASRSPLGAPSDLVSYPNLGL